MKSSLKLVLLVFVFGHASAFRSILHGGGSAVEWCAPTRRWKSSKHTSHPTPHSTSRNLPIRHIEPFSVEGKPEIILVDNENEEDLPADLLAEFDAGRPSELSVMKEILGINIFTYLLAAAIIFFFSMNFVLGPGWLGNTMGLKGTGTFTEISDSLPDTIDLSNSDYLL